MAEDCPDPSLESGPSSGFLSEGDDDLEDKRLPCCEAAVAIAGTAAAAELFQEEREPPLLLLLLASMPRVEE